MGEEVGGNFKILVGPRSIQISMMMCIVVCKCENSGVFRASQCLNPSIDHSIYTLVCVMVDYTAL